MGSDLTFSFCGKEYFKELNFYLADIVLFVDICKAMFRVRFHRFCFSCGNVKNWMLDKVLYNQDSVSN